MGEIRTEIRDDSLDVAAAINAVSAPECGGIGVFVGTVRSSPAVAGQVSEVLALEYETHPTLAAERLDGVAQAAAERWDIRRLVAQHRTGRCEVGEATVVVACSAPHRADALEACRWMIDEIKLQVPIWKREVYEDGSSWLGAGS